VRGPERRGRGLGERRVHLCEGHPDRRQAVQVALFDEALGASAVILQSRASSSPESAAGK
jgi:hypothetical protein